MARSFPRLGDKLHRLVSMQTRLLLQYSEISPLRGLCFDSPADPGAQLIRQNLVRQSICEFGTGYQTVEAPFAPFGVVNTAVEGIVQLIDDVQKQELFLVAGQGQDLAGVPAHRDPVPVEPAILGYYGFGGVTHGRANFPLIGLFTPSRPSEFTLFIGRVAIAGKHLGHATAVAQSERCRPG